MIACIRAVVATLAEGADRGARRAKRTLIVILLERH